MASRQSRSVLGAVLTAVGAFLLLTFMVVVAPADAAQKDANGGGKPTAASTSSPQPKSNADMNPGGANNGGDCGAYCSTRDGSASGNGNGKGEAKGKPCAGCVGKADNKNPPGQQPDGSDHNKGYECDANHGIGRTNPAHTGCQSTTTTPPTTTAPPECVPTEEEPCVLPTVIETTPSDCVPTEEAPCETPSASPTTPADCVPTEEEPCVLPTVIESTPADCVPTEEEPCVLPTVIESPTVTPSVLGVKIVRPGSKTPNVAPGRLPRTGSPVPAGLLLLVGFGTLAAGVGLTVSSPKAR